MTPHTTPSGPNFVNKTSSSLLLHHAIWFQDFTVLNKIYHQPGMCPRQDQSPATILRNILSLIHNKVINTSNKSKIHLIYQFLLNKIISKSTCALCRELVTLSTLFCLINFLQNFVKMNLNRGPVGDQSWSIHFAMASFETYYS